MNRPRGSTVTGLLLAALSMVTTALSTAAAEPPTAAATPLNLAAMSCAKYENEVLAPAQPEGAMDPIDTVMWLFGFSVAHSGERVMYGDSLTAFGYALDMECKTNPTSTLQEAVIGVRSKRDNPMDLTRLDCATFEKRHVSLRKTDAESANTLTMWLFGYAVGLTRSHILDATQLAKFDAALEEYCIKHPQDTVYDALNARNPAVPR